MSQIPEPQTGGTREYRVASVEKTDGPKGAEGDNWCRYVIDNGYATLMGWRRGSLGEISEHAAQYAAELNTRNNKTPAAPKMSRRK